MPLAGVPRSRDRPSATSLIAAIPSPLNRRASYRYGFVFIRCRMYTTTTIESIRYRMFLAIPSSHGNDPKGGPAATDPPRGACRGRNATHRPAPRRYEGELLRPLLQPRRAD